jgi:hypothetical protein
MSGSFPSSFNIRSFPFSKIPGGGDGGGARLASPPHQPPLSPFPRGLGTNSLFICVSLAKYRAGLVQVSKYVRPVSNGKLLECSSWNALPRSGREVGPSWADDYWPSDVGTCCLNVLP